jgi:hypothetical protein
MELRNVEIRSSHASFVKKSLAKQKPSLRVWSSEAAAPLKISVHLGSLMGKLMGKLINN